VSFKVFCGLLEGRTLINLASPGDDTSYINALNPSVTCRRETSSLIKFDESHMPLQQEYLRYGEVSSPRFMTSSFTKRKGAREKRKKIFKIFCMGFTNYNQHNDNGV